MPIQPSHIDSSTKIERVKKSKKKKSKKGSLRQNINVDAVKFHGIASDLQKKLRLRLADAGEEFANERYEEADKLLLSIENLCPGVSEVHELHGLVYYRQGKWKKAIVELTAFENSTGSVEQHPVLADCHRAMKHWTKTEEIWQELREESPSFELIEEGRIVQAGCLSDRQRYQDAIRLLENAPKHKGKPTIYHLRRWYYLADLYERAGDSPHARRLFKEISKHEPHFADVAERLVSLN